MYKVIAGYKFVCKNDDDSLEIIGVTFHLTEERRPQKTQQKIFRVNYFMFE